MAEDTLTPSTEWKKVRRAYRVARFAPVIMHGDDAVYIGRGNLRDRLALPERRGWTFDRIEYSVVGDDAAERRWEAFWLNEYRRRHNRWPIYNRIAGVAGETQATG